MAAEDRESPLARLASSRGLGQEGRPGVISFRPKAGGSNRRVCRQGNADVRPSGRSLEWQRDIIRYPTLYNFWTCGRLSQPAGEDFPADCQRRAGSCPKEAFRLWSAWIGNRQCSWPSLVAMGRQSVAGVARAPEQRRGGPRASGRPSHATGGRGNRREGRRLVPSGVGNERTCRKFL